MASFRCHDNSDVIATLIITNFHLYLIQLWWQLFQMFVYGDVVFLLKLRSYWPRKTVSYHFICQDDLCCCIVWPSFLFDCFVFGQMVYPPPPPPLQKIARTPKQSWKTNKKMKTPGRHFHIWSPYKGEFLAVPEKWSTHNSMLCELCWFQDEYCLKQGYLASKISASAQQQTNERCRISQL